MRLFTAVILAFGTLAAGTVCGAESPYTIKYDMVPTNKNMCGVDALYVCLGCLNGPREGKVTLAGLESSLPLGADGVSMADLARACRERGVLSWAVRTDLDTLLAHENPAVLHVTNSHFIALLGRDGDRLAVFDNVAGLISCTPEWFDEHYKWKGDALIVGPPPPALIARAYAMPLLLLAGGAACVVFAMKSYLARRRVPPPLVSCQ